jgi:hypothetical protein
LITAIKAKNFLKTGEKFIWGWVMFFKKRLFLFLGILLFIILAYFAFYLLTKNYLLPKVLKIVGVEEIKKIELSPFFNYVAFSYGKGKFFDFQKVEIEFSLASLFLRKLFLKKVSLENLVFKWEKKNTERREREGIRKNWPLKIGLPFFWKAIEIKELNLVGGHWEGKQLTLRNLQINLFLILKDGLLKGEVKHLAGDLVYQKALYKFSLKKADLLLNDEKFALFLTQLKLKNSLFTGNLLYSWQDSAWQIKIDSALILLEDFTDYQGKGFLSGDLKIKNGNYYGQAKVYFPQVRIKEELEELNLTLKFLEKKVFYQLTGKVFNTSFKTNGFLQLEKFSYELILEIGQFKKFLPLEIKKGYLRLTGEKLKYFNFALHLELSNEKVAAITAQGVYLDKKIFLQNLIGKNKEKETCFSSSGEITKEKIVFKSRFNSLPVDFLTFFLKKEITGFLNGFTEIIYFPSNKKIEFAGTISLKAIKTPIFNFDSLTFSGFTHNFSLKAYFENGALKITGLLLNNSFDSLVFSFESLLFVFNGNQLKNEKAFVFELKRDFFKLSPLNLKQKETEIEFSLEKERNFLNFVGSLKNFSLDNLFLAKKEKLSGKSNFYFNWQYDFRNKTFINFLLETKISQFSFKDFSLDSIQGNFSVAKETIKVKGLSLFKKGDESKITGFLLFDFAKKELVNQNLTFVFKNFPSEIIFFLPQILTTKEGKINGEVNLTGNLKDFQMTGRAKLSDCEVILKIPETKIKNLSGIIDFSHRDIYLTNLWGRTKEGEVFANGVIRLGNFFKVETLYKDIKFKNLPLNYGKDFMGIVSGNVWLSLNKKNYLKIIGDCEIKEALITLPFEKREASVKSNLDTLLELELTFKGERNIWLRNKNADLEMAVDFSLRLKKGEFTYSGQIKTLQGNLYYLGRRLQLAEGEMVFENIPNFDPKISLTGFLLTKPLKYDNKKERFKIILKITGHLSSPNFLLISDPPYLSEEQMISYLGLSFTFEELKNWEERSLFLDILQERLLSYFEKETGERLRKYIGLSHLRLESSFLEKPYLRLEVGKYLGEKLYFSYTHTFLEETKDVFRAEYFLKENQRLIGERNEQGKTIIKYLFYFEF